MFRLIVAILSLSALVSRSPAQPKPIPAPVPLPQAPVLKRALPLGVQTGTTTVLEIPGQRLADPVGWLASFPATVEIRAGSADVARLGVTLPDDAPLGLHSLRLVTRAGISNAIVVCVDELPSATTGEKRTKSAPGELPAFADGEVRGCVADGRVDAQASEFHAVEVPAGARLTFEILARRIGSPLDPLIALYDAATGRELPGVYSDDEAGLSGDARLSHTFERAGRYLVEVRDSTYRGGGDFFYRLRVGDFPMAITPFPLALRRGSEASVDFAGPFVEGASPVTVHVSDGGPAAIQLAPRFGDGPAGWPVELLLSDHEQILETEPNDSKKLANRLPVPGGASGRFLEKGDQDVFVFRAAKGRKLTLAVDTHQVRSPALVYAVLTSGDGKELSRSKPGEDVRIEFTPSLDGDYFLTLEHLNYEHGPDQIYHLRLREDTPDFGVTLGSDRFPVWPGGTGVIPIQEVTRRGYAGPIELSVVGDGLEGTVTIPAGHKPQPGVPAALLPVRAGSDVPPGPVAVRVRATGGGLVRFARLDEETLRGTFAGLPVPPRSLADHVAVGVTEPPGFALTPAVASLDVARGKPGKFTLSAARQGADGAITLQAVGLPPNVDANLPVIGQGATEVEVTVTPKANAPVGPYPITVLGVVKRDGKDVGVYAEPLTLNILEK